MTTKIMSMASPALRTSPAHHPSDSQAGAQPDDTAAPPAVLSQAEQQHLEDALHCWRSNAILKSAHYFSPTIAPTTPLLPATHLSTDDH